MFTSNAYSHGDNMDTFPVNITSVEAQLDELEHNKSQNLKYLVSMYASVWDVLTGQRVTKVYLAFP